MPNFSNAEYADIMFVYGFCNGNAAEARREYQVRFPQRRVPNERVFSTTYRRIAETGTVIPRPRIGAPEVNVNVDEDILERFEEDPTTSTRKVASELGLTQSKVARVMKRSGQHAFHYTPVQGLEEGDPQRRISFCRYLLNADIDNPRFLSRILWTDESKFSREGITNFHNLHFWAQDNPHKKRKTSFQRKFSVNVWMGVIGSTLIGPHFLPDNLNGEAYEAFLNNVLPELLDDVPYANRIEMFFQHDGCPAHYSINVRQFLDQRFPNRWIGRGGPILWPPRSPDLTPLDFYVWGHMKEKVYAVEILNRDQLMERIQDAAIELRNNLDNRLTRGEIRKRAQACIRNDGGHFENFL